MSTRDCPACGHMALSHNSGTCNVMKSDSLARGFEDFGPNGCGCTALGTDRTCPTCGKPFYCGEPEHEAHDCYACYNRKKNLDDQLSFAPLVDELRKVGIPDVPDMPWNTGGNVMCLAVQLPLPPGAPADADKPYFLFSDHGELLGAGLYFGDGGWMNFSPNWAPEAEARREAAEDDSLWAWEPYAARTAQWFRPVYDAVAGWLAAGGLTLTTHTESSSFGDYVATEAVVNSLPPMLAGTLFEPGEGYPAPEGAEA